MYFNDKGCLLRLNRLHEFTSPATSRPSRTRRAGDWAFGGASGNGDLLRECPAQLFRRRKTGREHCAEVFRRRKSFRERSAPLYRRRKSFRECSPALYRRRKTSGEYCAALFRRRKSFPEHCATLFRRRKSVPERFPPRGPRISTADPGALSEQHHPIIRHVHCSI